MNTERLLIVEDDPSLAETLQYQLESERYNVFVANNGSEALAALDIQNPHLVLLDIRLPDSNGFDLCRKIRSDGRRIPILILSALDSESDRILGLELGADDYISKPYKLKEVVARVRSSLRRAYGSLSVSSGKTFSFGEIRFDVDSMRVFRGVMQVTLTPAEFRLAKLLIENPDKIFSRTRLIEEVYGEQTILDERSIDVHMHFLRSKLESDQKHPQWFITVHGFGYKFTFN